MILIIFEEMERKLRRILESAIDSYRRYHGAEAYPEIHSVDEESGLFSVIFRGPFCRSCGLYDYFEDLVYELKALGIDARILDYEELEDGSFLVRYAIQESGDSSP